MPTANMLYDCYKLRVPNYDIAAMRRLTFDASAVVLPDKQAGVIYDKGDVEPVDIVLVQLQKTPYAVWETRINEYEKISAPDRKV